MGKLLGHGKAAKDGTFLTIFPAMVPNIPDATRELHLNRVSLKFYKLIISSKFYNLCIYTSLLMNFNTVDWYDFKDKF